MSKLNTARRIKRLLISAFVIPAGLGLSILHVQADGMPGLFRKESSCTDTTGRSMAGSACDCPHCREANSSHSPLRRFFKSHTTKWSERTPKDSWQFYHPCPPYFQPTFGVYQTSWTILQNDACEPSFATAPVDADAPSRFVVKLGTSPPPVPTGIPVHVEPMTGHVTPAAAVIYAGDSKRQIQQTSIAPEPGTSAELERPQASLRQESAPSTNFQRQLLQQTVTPAASEIAACQKLGPRPAVTNSSNRSLPDSDGSVPFTAFEFAERRPDALFTSQNNPLFPTTVGADSGAVSHLK